MTKRDLGGTVKKACLRRWHLEMHLNGVRERNHVQPWEKKPAAEARARAQALRLECAPQDWRTRRPVLRGQSEGRGEDEDMKRQKEPGTHRRRPVWLGKGPQPLFQEWWGAIGRLRAGGGMIWFLVWKEDWLFCGGGCERGRGGHVEAEIPVKMLP